MLYQANKGQVTYGEAVGILAIDTFLPFIPGDVGNASTFSFPTRYHVMEGLTFEQLHEKDDETIRQVINEARKVEEAGVRAITSDCGFMILYQQELADALEIPVFSSSLLQLSFMEKMLRKKDKIGIISADGSRLHDSLIRAAGADPAKTVVKGMEDKPYFAQTVLKEEGVLYSEEINKEATEAAVELLRDDPSVSAILIECSSLPPYAKSIRDAVKLPVFDYVTMIEYVYRGVVKEEFSGFV